MLRNLLTLSLVLVSFCSLKAQEKEKATLTFGLKTGINLSMFTDQVSAFKKTSVYYDASYESYVRISGLFGVTADYTLPNKVSLNAELLYNARGMAYRKEDTHTNTIQFDHQGRVVKQYSYFKFNIDYLELPLSVAYNFMPASSDTWFNGYLGVVPGIAIVKETNPAVVAGTWSLPTDNTGNLNNVNSFNASVMAGLQLGLYHWASAGFYGDLRGSYTLLPVFKEDSAADFKTKMFTGTIGIGVKF